MYDLDKNIEILKNSKSKLVELDKMNNFFKILDLSSVLINTSLIISYFESNIEREDLGKLELFNLQYTDSLLELLRKVKSNKEREIAGVTVKYNRFIYEQKRLVYNNPNLDEEFVISKKLHELEISILFENFFNNIEYKDFNKLISFHKKYSNRYFYNIDEDDKKFIESEKIKYYTRFNTKIDSELLELVANKKFKIKLAYGFNSKETSFELFIIEDSDIVFLWNINKKCFYISQSNFYSFGEMLNSVQTKIENYSGELQSSINEIMKDIPKEVNKLINKYNKVLEDIIYNSESYDTKEEENILKAMLDLKIGNSINISINQDNIMYENYIN